MFKGAKLLFGAPVALLAPYVGYMLTWVIAWIMQGVPGSAVGYWPPNLYCVDGGLPVLYCGRSPSDLDQFMLVFFFACCLVGWEAVNILMPGRRDPTPIPGRRWYGSYIVQGLAWSVAVLPTLIILPHILATIDGAAGVWGFHGWGGETMLDFFRSWLIGVLAMFGYALFRNPTLPDY